jgi:hypothetical protein
VRALASGLGLAWCLAVAGCSSSGNSCTDRGGTCNPGAVCPAGKQLVTAAQIAAVGGVDSYAYACPSNAFDSGNTNIAYCCLPIPAAGTTGG